MTTTTPQTGLRLILGSGSPRRLELLAQLGLTPAQGPASAFIPWINGSFHAVMGLPLPETAGLLTAAGFPLFGDAP